jgi:hypothetical protein
MSIKDDKQKQYDLISKLAEIVTELDWVIGLPTGTDDLVPGLIVGTEAFVREVVETYYGPNYSVLSEDPSGEQSLVETTAEENENKTDKKTTYH